MAAKDLITLDRAYYNLQGVTGIDNIIGTLITAASDGIRKYTRRDFISTSYDELYDGNGGRTLLLRQYPIQSVKSVRYRPVTVMKVINNNMTLNQQARVQVTSTGLVLSAVASGVPNATTLLFATYVTIQALATQINTMSSTGWAAQTVGDPSVDYDLWPSQDLYVPSSFGDGLTSQGNLTARGQNAELKMHTYELAGYQFDPRGWLLRAIPYTDPELLHPEDLVWPPGILNFRIQYTAGYTTIPEGVQEACTAWVAYMYYAYTRNPNVISTATAPSGGTALSTTYGPLSFPPAHVQFLLKPYRRHTIGID